MKTLLLFPLITVALLVLIPVALVLLMVGTLIFSPVLASVSMCELPAKFYNYVK